MIEITLLKTLVSEHMSTEINLSHTVEYTNLAALVSFGIQDASAEFMMQRYFFRKEL